MMILYLCGPRALLNSLGWQRSINNFHKSIKKMIIENNEKIEISYVDCPPYYAQAQQGDLVVLVIDATKVVYL
jgi:hypothetical protein